MAAMKPSGSTYADALLFDAHRTDMVQEWGKHGTCYSTLNPNCYTNYHQQEEVVDFFTQTTNLFQSLPTYEVSMLLLVTNLVTKLQ